MVNIWTSFNKSVSIFVCEVRVIDGKGFKLKQITCRESQTGLVTFCVIQGHFPWLRHRS